MTIMSIGHSYITEVGLASSVALPPGSAQSLHRLAVVRRQQGVSRHAVASRLNVGIEKVRQQENESSDLPLSMLYAWGEILDVPIAELLAEPSDGLPAQVLLRSQLVRLMKTVRTTLEKAKQDSVRWLVQTMINQLVEIMPELSEVGVWNVGGRQRRRSELGVAAERRLASEMFVEKDEEEASRFASYRGEAG
jgi:transcriptional regulator with XRE-family HTH domain